MNGEHANAIAGPSNSQATAKRPFSPSPSSAPHHPPPPLLFRPPSVPPPPRQQLHSTQDLLKRFQLLSAYDKYVRPAAVPGSDGGFDGAAPTTPGPVTPGGVDKGKGREVVSASGGLAVDHSPEDTGLGDGGDGDDDDGPGGKGEKKKKNSYKHLIKGVPGKHSMKKDDYLSTMMLVPPKQHIQITSFDARTQRESFTVSPEGLKGWNINALVLESAQAREDRKKRKELKRLAKAQQAAQQAGVPGLSPATQPQPIQVPIPTSATGSTFRATDAPTPRTGGTSTPRSALVSGTPRPGSSVPRSGSTNPRSTVDPRPVSAVTRPGSTAPPSAPSPTARPTVLHVQVPTARVGTPLRTATPTSAHPIDHRGIKREREESNGVGTGGLLTNGVSKGNGVGAAPVNGTAAKTTVNAKPGTGAIRPRPIKKQRMDIQGQARDVTTPVQQQPTPQGV